MVHYMVLLQISVLMTGNQVPGLISAMPVGCALSHALSLHESCRLYISLQLQKSG